MADEIQLLPQNIEAERSLLGSILMDNDMLMDAREYVESQDFYRRAHQLIYQAMITLNERSEAIDTLTLSAQLERNKQLDDIGGMPYLTDLMIATPTPENVGQYAKMIKDCSTLRQLIKVTTDITKKSYENDEDVDDLLDEATNGIMRVAEHRDNQDLKQIDGVVRELLAKTQELAENGQEITGLATGYPDFDRMTTGLHEDELVILAARPAVGKTAFALNIAQNVAIRSGKTVAIFSLEMGAESLVSRMICAEGMLESQHVRTGQMDDQEWSRFFSIGSSLAEQSIYIDDTPGIKVSEIRAKCKRLAQEKHGIDLIIIDYLQLIEGTGRESRQQEVSYISRQLKKLAKELKVPIIALSQLSRGIEQRNDKLPMLSDLRESGSIEQDADIVAFLHRDYYERENKKDELEGMARDDAADAEEDNTVKLLIEKNRSGARGTVELAFIKKYNKFTSISRRTDIPFQ